MQCWRKYCQNYWLLVSSGEYFTMEWITWLARNVWFLWFVDLSRWLPGQSLPGRIRDQQSWRRCLRLGSSPQPGPPEGRGRDSMRPCYCVWLVRNTLEKSLRQTSCLARLTQPWLLLLRVISSTPATWVAYSMRHIVSDYFVCERFWSFFICSPAWVAQWRAAGRGPPWRWSCWSGSGSTSVNNVG